MDCTSDNFKLLYFEHQQWLYEEGYPSVWGYWNRMAEYLMSPFRRIRHATKDVKDKDGAIELRRDTSYERSALEYGKV